MGDDSGEEEVQQSPLMRSFYESDSEECFERTGTIWTATAHIITGLLGAGVLSLAWSTAQLGWVAGPLTMVIFAATTILSANILCDCYRFPDPEFGPTRNRSYMEAVKLYLGDKSRQVCVLFYQESFYGSGIAYTITFAISARYGNTNGKTPLPNVNFVEFFGWQNVLDKAIQKSNCYHKEGHEASCHYGDTIYMLLFGAVQIVVSQIPDIASMVWLSVVATIMSFSYSFLGLGLGIAKVIENGKIKGSIEGLPADSMAKKVWLVFQALGDFAFAFPFPLILLDIQDTLKSPPPENQSMKKASMAAVSTATFFYLCCGFFGYAAFGSDTPGNLLSGFGFYEPYWLIDFANACIMVNLIGGYQIYSQPLFAFMERWFGEKFPNSGFVNSLYTFKLPLLPTFQLNLFRLCFRTSYVISTTIIAMIFPYFNQVLGVLGALNYWPLAIYFPMEMYFVQKKIGAWTRKWIVLQTFSIVCLLVSILALIGSVEELLIARFG